MPRDPMEPYQKLHDGGIDLLDEQGIPFVTIPWGAGPGYVSPADAELIALHEASILSCIAERKAAA